MTTRQDDFTGTANTNLNAHTASGTNGGWSWTLTDGNASSLQINAANQIKAVAADVGGYQCADPGSLDHFAQAKLYQTDMAGFLTVRLTDTSNYYGLRHNGGDWQLYKSTTAGGFALLGSFTAALVAGDVGYIEAVGTAITVKINGTTQIGPVTDSALATGRPGLVGRGEGLDPWADDFMAAPTTVLATRTISYPTDSLGLKKADGSLRASLAISYSVTSGAPGGLGTTYIEGTATLNSSGNLILDVTSVTALTNNQVVYLHVKDTVTGTALGCYPATVIVT